MSFLSFLKLRRHKEGLSCKEIRELSSDYIERSLPESLMDKVRRHLSFCPPCSNFIDSLSRTVNLLRGLPKEEVPPEAREHLKQRLARESGRPGNNEP